MVRIRRLLPIFLRKTSNLTISVISEKDKINWSDELIFYFISHKIFVLSLSYLRMLSDELFLKAELNKKIGLKTSKKGPGAPVIDIDYATSWSLFTRFLAKIFK